MGGTGPLRERPGAPSRSHHHPQPSAPPATSSSASHNAGSPFPAPLAPSPSSTLVALHAAHSSALPSAPTEAYLGGGGSACSSDTAASRYWCDTPLWRADTQSGTRLAGSSLSTTSTPAPYAAPSADTEAHGYEPLVQRAATSALEGSGGSGDNATLLAMTPPGPLSSLPPLVPSEAFLMHVALWFHRCFGLYTALHEWRAALLARATRLARGRASKRRGVQLVGDAVAEAVEAAEAAAEAVKSAAEAAAAPITDDDEEPLWLREAATLAPLGGTMPVLDVRDGRDGVGVSDRASLAPACLAPPRLASSVPDTSTLTHDSRTLFTALATADALPDEALACGGGGEVSGDGSDGQSAARTVLSADVAPCERSPLEVDMEADWAGAMLGDGPRAALAPARQAKQDVRDSSCAVPLADEDEVAHWAPVSARQGRGSAAGEACAAVSTPLNHAAAAHSAACSSMDESWLGTPYAAVGATAVSASVPAVTPDGVAPAGDGSSDSGGDGSSSCAMRLDASHDGGRPPPSSAVQGWLPPPPPAALPPHSGESHSVGEGGAPEETVLTQPSLPRLNLPESEASHGRSHGGGGTPNGADALYSPPPRVRRALSGSGSPPMARGVAVTAVPAPTVPPSTTHPIALAALAAPGVQTVELTERPDGATQLIVVLAGGFPHMVASEPPEAGPPANMRPTLLSAVMQEPGCCHTAPGAPYDDGLQDGYPG